MSPVFGGFTGRTARQRRRAPKETLETQFAQQLDALQLDERALTGLRAALTELHGQEREYRTAVLTALRTRNDDVHKKKDVLLDRHLAGVVPDDEYVRKLAAPKEEQVVLEAELRALEIAQDRFFEEIALLLQLAGRLRQIYELGTDDRKVAVIKLVASNAVLDGRNARLNLFPPFQVLAKARGHTRWLGIIKDLRTALLKEPIPTDVVKELLAA